MVADDGQRPRELAADGEGRQDEVGGTLTDDGPGLVSDDEARTIIRELFQRLKDDGYIGAMRSNQKRDEICMFDQSIHRIWKNRLLFIKLIQSYKNGNIKVLYPSFGEEKVDLMTLDHALLCLLERFEHIPRTFKMICNKKFFDEVYKRPDYMLGTLLRILDEYRYSQDSRKCRRLVDTDFRNKIAHNEYWQGTKDGKFALQFMAGKRCRKIGIRELEETFRRLGLVNEIIYETCEEMECWYDAGDVKDCEKGLQKKQRKDRLY